MGIDLKFGTTFQQGPHRFNLDIEVQTQATRIGILGASGCGKSATLKAIAGLVTPEYGHIVIDDEVLFDRQCKINVSPAKRRCGLLFQNYQLFTNMTVEQNIAMGLIRQNHVSRWGRAKTPQAQAIIERYLDLLHIRTLAQQPVYHLSGGQQQRVALARMLASNPRIVMLDEPFSALDAHLKTELYPQLKNLLDGIDRTVLYVTHDIDEVCRFCDWLVVIDNGQIVEMGSKQQILHHPKSLAALKLGGGHVILPATRLTSSQVQIEGLNQPLQVEADLANQVSAVGISQRNLKILPPDTRHAEVACSANLLAARVRCVTHARHRLLVSCQLMNENRLVESMPLITVSLGCDAGEQTDPALLAPDSDIVLYFDPASLICVR